MHQGVEAGLLTWLLPVGSVRWFCWRWTFCVLLRSSDVGVIETQWSGYLMLWFDEEQILKVVLVADGVYLCFLMGYLAGGPIHWPVSKGVLPCGKHHGGWST